MNAAIGFAQALDRQQCGDHAHSAVSIRGGEQRGFRCGRLPAIPDRLQHADDALGEGDHDQHDEAAQHQLGQIGLADQPDVERLVDDRADDRAGNRLDAAEQHHDQRIDRQRDAEAVRENAALEIGEQRAGKAGDGARDHEGGPLHALAVDADGFAAQRRIPRRAQRKAERREHDDPEHGDRERGDAERQPVEAGGTRRPFLRPDSQNAVVAAGHRDPLERDRPDDLRKGQGQHREIDAGQLHGEEAEHRRAEQAQQRAEQQRDDHRQSRHLGEERDAIGAEPEIGGVAERGEPADRHQEMQAGGEDHEDRDLASRPSARNCRRPAAVPPRRPARRAKPAAHSRSAAATD